MRIRSDATVVLLDIDQACSALHRYQVYVLFELVISAEQGSLIAVRTTSSAACEEGLRERHDDLLRGCLLLLLPSTVYVADLSLLVMGRLSLRKLRVVVMFVKLGVGLIGDHGWTLVHGLILVHRFHSPRAMAQVEVKVDRSLLLLLLLLVLHLITGLDFDLVLSGLLLLVDCSIVLLTVLLQMVELLRCTTTSDKIIRRSLTIVSAGIIHDLILLFFGGCCRVCYIWSTEGSFLGETVEL